MFSKCHEVSECKELFRKLSKVLHPDLGGQHELFILLKEAYDSRMYILNKYDEIQKQNAKKQSAKKENTQKYERSDIDVDDDESLEVIEEILIYAETHSKFNTSHTLSIKEYLEENGYVTSTQYNSLVKIYYAFRMNEKKPEKKEENES